MSPHLARADICAMLESIQMDIEAWKSRNAEDIERIQSKFNVLVAACTSEAKGAGESVFTAEGQSTPSSRASRRDPRTPESARAAQTQREAATIHSAQKSAAKDTKEGDFDRSPAAIAKTDKPIDSGRVSFTAQELFPKSDVKHDLATPMRLSGLSKGADFNEAEANPQTPTTRRSFGTDSQCRADLLRTPAPQTPFGRTPYSAAKQRLSSSPTMAIDSILPMHNVHEITALRLSYANGRPAADPVPGESPEPETAAETIPGSSCQVLVEFKRNRVYQYDSPFVIAPGKHAIVSGDRGDDLGLVIFSWFSARDGIHASGIAGASEGKMIGLGIGKVVRTATDVEVSVVHNVLKDLETQALEVCRARVRDLGIPMVVHDAEYQYDRKKLTFYYQAADRQDFRELIRDLYRTFKARIWMESVDDL